MKRLERDIPIILEELLHWKRCHFEGCHRCAVVDGKEQARTVENRTTEELFGKRYKDLSPEEKRQYHHLARERAARRNG